MALMYMPPYRDGKLQSKTVSSHLKTARVAKLKLNTYFCQKGN
jgi:hypothetical protein